MQHVIGGCTPLAGKDYLGRQKVLMVLAVAWAKKNGLLPEDTVWYKIRLEEGTILEKDGMKLVGDFGFKLRKTNAPGRPDLILEDNNKKRNVGMACPMEINKEGKMWEKITKYQQLMLETRERRGRYNLKKIKDCLIP